MDNELILQPLRDVLKEMFALGDAYGRKGKRLENEVVRKCEDIVNKKYWELYDEFYPNEKQSLWLNDDYVPFEKKTTTYQKDMIRTNERRRNERRANLLRADDERADG